MKGYSGHLLVMSGQVMETGLSSFYDEPRRVFQLDPPLRNSNGVSGRSVTNTSLGFLSKPTG